MQINDIFLESVVWFFSTKISYTYLKELLGWIILLNLLWFSNILESIYQSVMLYT